MNSSSNNPMRTLNQTNAARYLSAHYPEIKEEIDDLASHQNFAGVLQAVVNYLKQLLANTAFKTMSRQIRFVGWIYFKGDQYIRYIVENLFIRALVSIQKRCSLQQWHFLYIKLPKPFKDIYDSQNLPVSITSIGKSQH